MKFTLLIFILLTNLIYAKTLDKVSIQFNWKYQFEFAGFIAAKEKGFYNDVNLEVEFKEYDLQTDIMYDVLNQKTTYGISNSNVVLDKSKIAPIVLLATYLQKSPLVLVTQPSIKHPNQLIGKTIMGGKDELKYSSIALLFSHFGINNINSGFNSNKYDLNDFIEGKVDAITAFRSNQLYELDKKGISYNIIDPIDYGFVVNALNLYTSKKEALENKNRTLKFIEATNKGWEYALNNSEEIVDILISKYKVEKSKEALLYEAKIIKELVMRDLYPIGKVSSDLGKRLLKQLIYSGAIDQNQKIEPIFFDNDFERNINDFFLTKSQRNYLENKKIINLCVDPDWYPIEYVKDKKLYGFTSDIVKLFQEQIQTKIDLVLTKDWNESLEAAKNRQCDIISGISADFEREKFLNFTQPLLSLPILMATQNDKPFIQDISLIKEKVGILKGHFALSYLKEKFPNIEWIEVSSMNIGLKLVERNEIYGFIDNSLVLSSTIQKEFANSLKIGYRFDIEDRISIGIRNDEPILYEIFNNLVNDLDEEKKQLFLNNWTKIVEQVGIFTSKEIVIFSIVITLFLFSLMFYQIKLKKLNKELEKLSSTDKLTGLNNRFEIDKKLILEKEKVNRNNKYSCSLILIDVDHFKKINDTLGHLAGDEILKEVSNLFINNFRKTDAIGRWGGEEFMIILPFTTKKQAKIVAENIRVAVENKIFSQKTNDPVTISLGVGELLRNKTIEQTLYSIDKALYIAKEKGRNKIEVTS
ncbi:diguanylate cyclase [Aliarcobacter cibarius]|uniref:diguanylate cyclase n=1 Tax=Aliarcobacter cibarius TaxID=255507 RepID=A0A7L5JM18_9BACT|nr:diguanylate cyclase [Aliarcobacter cibarius]QKJ26265.1 BvgS-like domain-containing diguanylate cyclase (NMT1 domain) [Aliarcobacter cibarius]TLT02732.1 diguanylate cyclase [Aliarcobacter cibarius]